MRKAAKDSLFRFLKKDRLVSQHDFQSVFAKPRKASCKSLLALYQYNPSHPARLGLVISKHRVKLAVNRNLLRRIIRESFRHHKEALKGLDIIVLMRSEWCPLGKKALRDDIDHLWQSLINSLPAV